MRDITSESLDEQRMLQSIRADYERFNSLINNVPGIVYRVNASNGWQFDFISDAIKDILGLDPNQFRKNGLKLFYKYTHPDDIQRIKQHYLIDKNKPEQHFSEEYRMVLENNETIWVKNTGTNSYNASGELEYVDGVIVDITRTHNAEHEASKSELALTELQRISSDTDLNFAEKVTNLLKLGLNQLNLEYGMFGLIDGDDYVVEHAVVPDFSRIKSGYRVNIKDSYSSEPIKTRKLVCYKDVTNSPLSESLPPEKLDARSYIGAPIFINNSVVGTFCFSGIEVRQDDFYEKEINLIQLLSNWVSAQLQFQQVERESKQNLQLIESAFADSADAIYISDIKNGELISVNKQFEKVTGYTKKQLIGSTSKDLKLWRNDNDAKAFFDEIQHQGKIVNREVSFKNKNGEIKYALLTSNLIWFNERQSLLSIARDITASKQRKKEIEKYQQAIVKLHSISSTKQHFDDKVSQILKLILYYLDVETVHFGKVINDQFLIQSVVMQNDSPIKIKSGIGLDRFQCLWGVVIDKGKPIAYKQLGRSKFNDRYIHQDLAVESYLGTPIYIDNKPGGAIICLSTKVRTRKFSKSEIDFTLLIASWIGIELERQIANKKLIKNEQSTRDLYEISSDSSLSFTDKVDQILALCATYLDVEIGLYGEFTEDKYKLIRTHDQSGLGLSPGLELTREGSYCAQTASLNKTVALDHVVYTDYAELAGYKQLKFETYLGIPIEINGKMFGTICFLNKAPRRQAFTISEIEFIQLAAQWIATEQQRIISEKDRLASEQALNMSEGRQQTLVEIQPECVKQINADGELIYMNRSGLTYIEADSLEQVKGLCVYDVVIEEHRQSFIDMNARVFNGETVELEFEIQGLKGARRWMQTVAKPIYNDYGIVIEHFAVTRDITDKKEDALIVEMERNAYEIITKEVSLEKMIDMLILLIESYSPDMYCSLLFYDKQNHQLYSGCSPSLPKSYSSQIDKVPVFDGMGSFGAAAHRETCVVVSNIEHDPLWKDFRNLALEHNLKACWSNPLHSTKRQLLGVFACYYKECKLPTRFQKKLIFRITPILSYAIERHNAQESVAISDERFRMTFKHAPIGKLLLHDNGIIFDANQSVNEMLGYSENELIGKDFCGLCYNDGNAICLDNFKKLKHDAAHEVNFQQQFIDKKGLIRWGQIDAVLVSKSANSDSYIIVQVIDITDRVLYEQNLQSKTRALKVINECNHGIRHIDQFEQLLNYACDILVNTGGYRFCWVALPVLDADHSIRPIAYAGYEDGYLQNRFTWGESETGNGPLGRCIKNHTPVIIRNTSTDNTFLPWKEDAMARSYRSVVALPLLINPSLTAALLIYSDKTGAFNEDEVNLLSTLANNLTHAIRNLEIKKQKIATEKQLIANEEKYRMLVNDSGAIVWEVSLPDYQFTFVSNAAKNILGYEIEDWYKKDFWAANMHPNDKEKAVNYCKSQTEQGNDHEFEYRMVKKDGSVIWINDIVNIVFDKHNKAIKLRGLMIDITARKDMEEALKISEERFSLAMQGASDGLWDWDLTSNQIYFSPRWKSMLGYEENEISASVEQFTDLLHPDDVEKTFQHIDDFQNDKVNTYSIQFRMRHKQGHYLDILSRGFGVKNDDGTLTRMVGTHTDTSENTRLSRQLEYQASHDALTSLVNRVEFEKRLQRLVENQSIQIPGHAVCYLDLDNFKVINDTCGHLAGDAMLKQLSEMLLAAVRGRDTLARLGGDEFAILMEHCSVTQAQTVAEKILSIVQDFRFSWDGYKFTVGVSIGLVPINEASGNVNDILAAADTACYMAKDAGRNCIHVFSPDDAELEKRRGEMQWVARINQAMEEDLFCLFYQDVMPINFQDEQIKQRRFEILVRIRTNDGGYVLPGAFLPAAERYNLSTKIDLWVINETLDWLSGNEGLLDKIESCAINISGHSLGQQFFLNYCLDKI
ncbi:MAG: PAS domain S-box protein, partial [Pseudomonadota bacterium]